MSHERTEVYRAVSYAVPRGQRRPKNQSSSNTPKPVVNWTVGTWSPSSARTKSRRLDQNLPEGRASFLSAPFEHQWCRIHRKMTTHISTAICSLQFQAVDTLHIRMRPERNVHILAHVKFPGTRLSNKENIILSKEMEMEAGGSREAAVRTERIIMPGGGCHPTPCFGSPWSWSAW